MKTKNILYKKIATIFLTLLLILPYMSCVHASNEIQSEKGLELIKKDLEDEGTCVENELKKMLNYYKDLLNSENITDEEKVKINNLITYLNEDLYSLNNSKLFIARSASTTNNSLVLWAIAWFNNKGYKLAGELLLHALHNKTLKSTYSPVNGHRVKSSPIYYKIKESRSSNGTDIFLNSGTTIQKDLYYSIREFSWRKLTGTITITDLYDYAPGDSYSGLEQYVIDGLHRAQKEGVITPFYTKIVIN